MGEKCPDVVVLLPGITGSELVKDDRVIWGWSGGALLRNLISAGDALRRDLWLADDSPTAWSLDDGISASRLLPDLHLIPRLWKINGYGAIAATLLKSSLELRARENFFPFPYDWRRDNRAAAHRLRNEAAGWLASWRKRSGNAEAKLILVGHSMGGLIARYFLEVLEGWRDARALVTFGTPYAGSINAVDTLVNGVEKFGVDLTGVLRRFNSLHQLLPTYECCDAGNGTLQRLGEVTLPNLDVKRFADAQAFHAEIRLAAERNAADAEYNRTRYEVIPVVGDNQPTRQFLRLNGANVELLEFIGDTAPSGDGTVPRQSAVPFGFKLSSAMFASTKHAALQNSPAVLSHVVGAISSLQLQAFRGCKADPMVPIHVSLDIDDIYQAPAPVVIRARPSGTTAVLRLSVHDGPTDRIVLGESMEPEADGWYRIEFVPPRSGSYRVVVDGMKGVVEQASDVFEFLDRQAMAA